MEPQNTNPRSYTEFGRKWTPAEFCGLPLCERGTVLLGLLNSTNAIFIRKVKGGYNFATVHTPIHKAIPLLYDYNTNKQIAREALEVFYQNNVFVLSSRWLSELVQDQTDTGIKGETIQPRLHFRKLVVLLERYEPQTPGDTPIDLANLMACTQFGGLRIEICTPANFSTESEDIKKWTVNEAKALGFIIRQLQEKFGFALKVFIGGPFPPGAKIDITWMWDRPSEEVTRFVTMGLGTEAQMIMYLMWTAWSRGGV